MESAVKIGRSLAFLMYGLKAVRQVRYKENTILIPT